MTQRFLAAHPRCPLRGHRVYEAKHRCDTPLFSGPPIGGLLHFSVSFRFLPSSTPSPLRGPLPPRESVSRDFQVAVAPLQITFACHLKGTQEFVPMKRSYHFYSYHSADLAAYHGQPTKRKALLNFSFPLEGKCHEVAKGCTRARMIMLLPLLPYAGPISADLRILCRMRAVHAAFETNGNKYQSGKEPSPVASPPFCAAGTKGGHFPRVKPGCMVFPSLLLNAQIDRNVQRP